ncbi:terminase gpP N-terminus-related DNA-binding protein, partial [Pseudomonas aeruginosa]|uniref:terminase gpP N-terminus-related DNA-binding protein n=2 Tax=Pseudomonas TaxID=286 RepID=UPI0005AA2FE1
MSYSIEVKEAAKRLYLRRAKPKEIQAQLGLPNVRIVYYWIARGGWDELLTDEEPLAAISRRITLIAEKPGALSKADLDELDRLTSIRERLQKQAVRPAPS